MKAIIKAALLMSTGLTSACTAEGQRVFNCNPFPIKVVETGLQLSPMSYFARRIGSKPFDSTSRFRYPDGKSRLAKILSNEVSSRLLDNGNSDDAKDISRVCAAYPSGVVILTM